MHAHRNRQIAEAGHFMIGISKYLQIQTIMCPESVIQHQLLAKLRPEQSGL